jgi:hypothetical protein
MALRNRNGGYLVIGLEDKSLTRIPRTGREHEINFHVDVIQGIISRFSYPPFEISVKFGVIDGTDYPIIVVPEGVTVPVACKRDLADSSGRVLLREDGVYFRTLNANGTPSTSLAKAADWRDIVEICFDNRETDIGRFLRKHLGREVNLKGFVADGGIDQPSLRQRAITHISDSESFRQVALNTRLSGQEKEFAEKAGQYAVALVLDPTRPHDNSDTSFLNTVSGANPQYTGWPAWLDSRNFTDQASRPVKVERAWQALIWSYGRGFGAHADFIRMHAKGEFYLWRILQDDLTDKVPPYTKLDVALVVYRVAEILAVGLAFAKALDQPETSKLGFAFKWWNISGRELDSWANPMRMPPYGRRSFDNEVESYVELNANTPPQAVAPYVLEAVRDLLLAFDGFSISLAVVESIVTEVLRR